MATIIQVRWPNQVTWREAIEMPVVLDGQVAWYPWRLVPLEDGCCLTLR